MEKLMVETILVERFEVTQHIAACSSIKVDSMGISCVLDSNAPDEMRDMALQGYFMSKDFCYQYPTDGAICYNASVNMAFPS